MKSRLNLKTFCRLNKNSVLLVEEDQHTTLIISCRTDKKSNTSVLHDVISGVRQSSSTSYSEEGCQSTSQNLLKFKYSLQKNLHLI